MGAHNINRPDPASLRLSPPDVYIFSGEHCSKAYALNRFAFRFKYQTMRNRFLEEPEQLMEEYGLSEVEKRLLRARDWTSLVAMGGHHWTIMKIAFAVGESHLHIGAQMAGKTWQEVEAECPYDIDLMPEDFE